MRRCSVSVESWEVGWEIVCAPEQEFGRRSKQVFFPRNPETRNGIDEEEEEARREERKGEEAVEMGKVEGSGQRERRRAVKRFGGEVESR